MLQSASSAVIDGTQTAITGLISLPGLTKANRELNARNRSLEAENARLNEQVAAYKQTAAIAPVLARYSNSIPARVIGYPPEDESRTVTINRGSRDGVHKDDGVVAAGGVVGTVDEVTPFSSRVVLISDYTSRVPAMVQRGRWWGIARGNLTSVRVEYLSQDAPLKVGDVVVTGEARSFHSGEVLGRIAAIEHGDAALYQTAVVKPAVDLGALDSVVVLPK